MTTIGTSADRALHYVALLESATSLHLPTPIRWLVALSLFWLAVADVVLLTPTAEHSGHTQNGHAGTTNGHDKPTRESPRWKGKGRELFDGKDNWKKVPFDGRKTPLRLDGRPFGSEVGTSLDDMLSPRSTTHTPTTSPVRKRSTQDRGTQSDETADRLRGDLARVQRKLDKVEQEKEQARLDSENVRS